MCFFVIVLILIWHFIYWFFLAHQKKESIEVIVPVAEGEKTDVSEPDVIFLSGEEYDKLSSLGFMIRQQVVSYPDMSAFPDMQDIPHISKVKKLEEVITYEEQLPHDVVEHKNILPKMQ